MTLDTAAFFESPRRGGAVDKDLESSFDVDAFFGERLDLAHRGGGEDALTEGTSPNTGATTPARSDGWIEEEEEKEKENEAKSESSQDPEPVEEEEEGLPLPPILAYSFDGRPVTIRRKKPRLISNNEKASGPSKNVLTNLVNIPLHRMMEQLASETARKLDIAAESPSTSKRPVIERVLWTDKYRPRHFTDLLGDERVNRDIMTWVKEWDACVFPEKVIGKRKKPVQEEEQQFIYQDEYHRPREKILLLSGPPGLGKTTLAHVVARQAGYAVMEINASDARTGNTIEDRIRPVLETGSAIGGTKPVLVVIDEIDGATGGNDNTSGFVNKLISLTFDRSKKKGRPKDKRDGRRPLLRPIICICNDLYASSLAKLRPICRIIRFQKPAPVHLIKRLKQICEIEDLRADSRSLNALVGISQGDMRGCLNMLQLLNAKHCEITEAIVRRATVGMKESESSFMGVVTDIFAPLTKSRVKDLGLTSEEEGKYVNRITRCIDSTGSLDKVALACFEHYLSYRIHDADFKAYEKAHEWLYTYDSFSQGMWQDREYAIMPYLAYSLTPFHPLFATKGGPKLERPKMDWEAFQKQRTYEEIYKTLSKNVLGHADGGAVHRGAVKYRHLVADGVLQLEFAPMINRIISPPLKPVNKQLIKPDERLLMERVVDIMVNLDLRFVQEKQEDGTLVYRLDPPIDVFVTYDEKRAQDIAVSRYATRHLIAAEIDAQVIERQAEAFEEVTKAKSSNFFNRRTLPKEAPSSPTKGPHDQDAPSSPVVPNRKRKREEPEIDIADKPPVDFFGRLVTSKTDETVDSSSSQTAPNFKVTYKYNEGMSAAVRKPVKISSLLT